MKLFIGCRRIKMKTPWGVMSQAQPGSSWSSTFWSSSPVNLASAWQGMKFSWPGLHVWHKLDLCVDLSIYFKKKVFLSFLDLSPTCLKSHWTPLYCSSHSKVLCLTNNKNVQSGCVVRIDPTPVCRVYFLALQCPSRATMFRASIRIQHLRRIESSFGTLFNWNIKNRSLHCPSLAVQGKQKGYNS